MTPTTDKDPFASVCKQCQSYICLSKGEDKHYDDDIGCICCTLCMDLWKPSTRKMLQDALETACRAYGGISSNRFGKVKTVTIGGEIFVRYKYYSSLSQSSSRPFSTYLQDLKHHLNGQLQDIILDQSTTATTMDSFQEEQGYLLIHVLCIPPRDMKPALYSNASARPSKRRKQRKRPFITQGGDPRLNLETRLEALGYSFESIAQKEEAIKNLSSSTDNPIQETQQMEIHVAAFRKPIYLYGYYTKARRDISQSPFVVKKETYSEEDKKKAKKATETLGLSSVEQEICGPVERLLGVSTQNDVKDSSTKYGMCKFHASGREDMDVRMLLRPNTIGRPFCIQLIDALNPVRSQEQLDELVKKINHTSTSMNRDKFAHYASDLWHGQSPLGVGISNNFTMAPAKAFSNLQADTESKVKFYGCYCWSEKKLPLASNNVSEKTMDITTQLLPNIKLPITIHQKTPLRVLHRRANIIRERKVLQVKAIRIDDHHFRLELSTEAGTYVKEFVHGDLRRTIPSIASLAGCKTNLLELDCEGIELTSGN